MFTLDGKIYIVRAGFSLAMRMHNTDLDNAPGMNADGTNRTRLLSFDPACGPAPKRRRGQRESRLADTVAPGFSQVSNLHIMVENRSSIWYDNEGKRILVQLFIFGGVAAYGYKRMPHFRLQENT